MELGLTSVTFRNLGYEEVIEHCKVCGISQIEWGSDIHVKENDFEKARKISEATKKEGIRVCSYGSYYELCVNENFQEVFRSYLETAHILNAKIIRLWAGTIGSEQISCEYYERAVKEARYLCDMAKDYNITLAFEFHSGTICDNADSAIQLYQDINRENCGLYYQYDIRLSEKENLIALEKMVPYIKMIHLYYYNNERKQVSLKDGIPFWQEAIKIIRNYQLNVNLLFEFLMDSSVEGLMLESQIMSDLLKMDIV